MPLLHIHLDSPTTVVELQHDLKPQTLILRSVMVNRDIMSAQSQADDALQIDLGRMFNGFEMLSNKAQDNKLFLPFASRPSSLTPAPAIYPLHLKMNAEEIKSRFEVKVFKKDGKTPVSFATGTDGHYRTIDLYFEFETAQHFETIFNPEGQGTQHI